MMMFFLPVLYCEIRVFNLMLMYRHIHPIPTTPCGVDRGRPPDLNVFDHRRGQETYVQGNKANSQTLLPPPSPQISTPLLFFMASICCFVQSEFFFGPADTLAISSSYSASMIH